jgi:hypothetical protein
MVSTLQSLAPLVPIGNQWPADGYHIRNIDIKMAVQASILKRLVT